MINIFIILFHSIKSVMVSQFGPKPKIQKKTRAPMGSTLSYWLIDKTILLRHLWIDFKYSFLLQSSNWTLLRMKRPVKEANKWNFELCLCKFKISAIEAKMVWTPGSIYSDFNFWVTNLWIFSGKTCHWQWRKKSLCNLNVGKGK